MKKTILRRAAAAGASAALLATGMSVAVTNGVASADQTSSSCEPTMTLTGDGITVTQTADKAEVAPGGTVTYQTKVSRSSGAWDLKEVGDFHDPDLTLTGSRLNVWYGVGGQKWGATHLQNDPDKGLYWERSGGLWDMNSKHYVTLETTYKVDDDATVGEELVSGVQAKPVGWSSQEWPDEGACVTVRDKNVGEQVSGSLDGLGFGSVNTASQNGSASLTDPQGSITGIINNIDFGKILGGALGS